MTGGLAPAEVVVVHTGQIVVDQGVGVEHLHGAAEIKGLLSGSPRRLTEFHGEDGTDALAPGQQAVPHGLLQSPAGEELL